MTIRVNIIYFPGTNCQRETAEAFRKVGAVPRIVFAEAAVEGRDRLDDADILCLPGGFSYGDHIHAGTIAGAILTVKLRDQLLTFHDKPILCICNGFQIGVKAGFFGDGVTLGPNASGTFCNRVAQPHKVSSDNTSLWLQGLHGETLVFPCAHAEGRFGFADTEKWRTALHYPPGQNPDGSVEGIAGITDTEGRVLGLMNHPERAQHRSQNLILFENGVRAVRG